MKPLPSLYYPDFIAANQSDRADNTFKHDTKQEDLEHLRKDIREFKEKNNLDRVIVVWTGKQSVLSFFKSCNSIAFSIFSEYGTFCRC